MPSRSPKHSPGRSPSRSPRSSLVPSPLGPPGPVAISEHRRRSKEARELARRESSGDLNSLAVGRMMNTPPPEQAIPMQMMSLQPPGMMDHRSRSHPRQISRVRRSSSDGDTYLNLVPSLRFVQGNTLESHSSDSAVLLNRDTEHMLNPHLSAFRKDSLHEPPPMIMSGYHSSIGSVFPDDIRPRQPQIRQVWSQQQMKSESSEHSSTATGSGAGRTDSSGAAQEVTSSDHTATATVMLKPRYSSPVLHFQTPPTTDDTASSSSSKDSYHR